MSDVASREPSLELAKLSGWKGEGRVYTNKPLESDDWHPKYSLGYLLRKLPAYVYSNRYEQKAYLWQRKDGDDKYCAWYTVNDPINYGEDHISEHGSVRDTPEDALCQLAIALWKAGVLK